MQRKLQAEHLELRIMLDSGGGSGAGGMAGEILYRVNVGGPEIVDTTVWTADSSSSPSPYVNSVGGNSFRSSTSQPVDVSDPSIPVGTPADLFDTYRYDLAGGTEMEWDFAVTPGSYEVRLYFAETWSGAQSTGVREFDVQIEGETLLDGYDIFADVGGFAGVTKTFTVTSDTNLDIDFLHQTENPAVYGIEIISAGELQGLLTSSANTLAFGNVAVNDSAMQVVTLTNNSPAGGDDVTIDPVVASISPAGAAFSFTFVQSTPIVLAPGEATDVTVTFAPLVAGSANATLSVLHSGTNSPIEITLTGQGQSMGAGEVVYRVNAGGSGLTGSPIWESDAELSPSPFLSNSSSNSGASSTALAVDLNDPSVPVGTPMALFQSGRFDLAGGGEMTWDFPVAAGDYEVRLYFAEIWVYGQGVGLRQFDVAVEGITVLDNYDVFAEVGGYTGVVKSFAVANTDGNIDIDFLHEIENPTIKGIEIISAPSMTLQPSTSSLDFGSIEISQTSDLPVVLTNNDSVDVTIDPSTSMIQPTESPFTVVFEQSEEIVLAPGEATTVTVTYAPTTENNDGATLSIPHSGLNSPVDISLSGTGFIAGSVNFSKSVLTTLDPINFPTSLQFGPDGRLYVSEQGGILHALTIVRNSATDYEVVAQEKIFDVANILNHNDQGVPEPGQHNRLVTGILVTGTAQNPVIFVSNSDPRIGAGPSGEDLNLDTNSGIVSRLTWNGTSWDKLDLVRGLPRSEENHGPNGMQLDAVNNILYLAIGLHPPLFAPSPPFSFFPSSSLSSSLF
ncbi:MAG: malectin domain-containing carbohydrate-binding protein, partial [Aeoliella sp.]